MWAEDDGIDVRFLIHGHDAKFIAAFDEHFQREDGGPVLTPYAAPHDLRVMSETETRPGNHAHLAT